MGDDVPALRVMLELGLLDDLAESRPPALWMRRGDHEPLAIACSVAAPQRLHVAVMRPRTLGAAEQEVVDLEALGEHLSRENRGVDELSLPGPLGMKHGDEN